MNTYPTYKDFRSTFDGLDCVDGIYVEIRTIKGEDEVVGFFGVDDLSEIVNKIAERKNDIWPKLHNKLQVLEKLNSVQAPSFMIFSDTNMTYFFVHKPPFDKNNYEILDLKDFKKLIEALGGIKLSGRESTKPKYPQKLSSYSVWHYSLDWSCKCRDIDYIEIRNGSPRAFFEITGNLTEEKHIKNSVKPGDKCIFNRLVLQQKILKILSSRLNVDAYFIIHTNDLSIFYIYDLDFCLLKINNKYEYEKWIRSL